MTDLVRLFRPKTISVIGGGVWCDAIIRQCGKIGYAGEIWPVHPAKAQIAGLTAYKDVSALPAAPDASFIGVNREATVSIVAALAAMDEGRGAGGAVCFASGFSETAGEDGSGLSLQAQLIEASGDMPIIGPNCYGFLNYLDGAALWPDQQGGTRIDRGVAILTQSSNIAINITMQKRGLPIAYVVTLGNQAKITLADVGRELLRDPRVTALGCHIEGFGDINGFETLAAEAHRLEKPLITLKVGKSAQARANAISHTASLAGSEAGADAFLKRLDVARVATLSEFLETLKLAHVFGRLPGTQIASLSCSGGEASLMADAGAGAGAGFPALGTARQARLRQALGERVALDNPLDYHTYIWHDAAALYATFCAMTGADIDITCVILDFPRPDRCDPAAWDMVLSSIERAAAKTDRPFAVVASLPETMPEAIAVRLIKAGIAPICGIEEIVKAVRATAASAGAGRADNPAAPVIVAPAPVNSEAVSEYETKKALAAYGVAIPKGARATSPEAAAHMAFDIGFPVALKGEGFAHKSENNAVFLNLETPGAVIRAATSMTGESYLVEEMIPDMLAELLLGVIRDPVYGLILVLAAGGVYTEILQDRQTLLVPSGREEVLAALQALEISPLLRGYRGRPAVNETAVIDIVMAVQGYVIENSDVIEEIELNPIFCREHDAVVVDALMRRGDKAPEGHELTQAITDIKRDKDDL